MADEPKLGPVARRLAATERVLSVEDEADIAAFLRAYFRAAGYDFVHVDPWSVDEIVEAVETTEPDLVLLDLRLRGFSGMEAYRRLRADSRHAFLPIVIVSAHAGSTPDFEAPRGIDAFVAKPFNTNVLASLVRDRIDTARALAAVGRDERFSVMTSDYLQARLSDEMAVTDTGSSFSFALVQLRSLDTIVSLVGRDGRDHVVTQLVEQARQHLPADAVLGRTGEDELAVLLPGRDMSDARDVLVPVIEEVIGEYHFAGGASVPVHVAAGLASYPDNGRDVDALFMAADLALADAVDADETLRTAM